MTFTLTDYQIAALQEMQIPVWQSQQVLVDKKQDEPAATQSAAKSKPVSQDTARSHLERLKNSVSAKPAVVNSGSETATPPAPEAISANAYPIFFADFNHALALLKLQNMPLYLGNSLLVSDTAITLPVTPDKLTAQHKKQLWQALCALN